MDEDTRITITTIIDRIERFFGDATLTLLIISNSFKKNLYFTGC